ncbi:hypothetical protein ACSSV4_000889 [Roseovarius sp. MBR-154]|jgi:hypothetical protein
MKTVIFHNDAGDVVRWVQTPRSSTARTPKGLHRLVIDGAVEDPTAWRAEEGALVPRGPDVAEAMRRLRQTRDRLLAASDWSQLPDAPCDCAAWAEYRRALRDLPQTTDPLNPVYPEQPRRMK